MSEYVWIISSPQAGSSTGPRLAADRLGRREREDRPQALAAGEERMADRAVQRRRPRVGRRHEPLERRVDLGLAPREIGGDRLSVAIVVSRPSPDSSPASKGAVFHSPAASLSTISTDFCTSDSFPSQKRASAMPSWKSSNWRSSPSSSDSISATISSRRSIASSKLFSFAAERSSCLVLRLGGEGPRRSARRAGPGIRGPTSRARPRGSRLRGAARGCGPRAGRPRPRAAGAPEPSRYATA